MQGYGSGQTSSVQEAFLLEKKALGKKGWKSAVA